MNLTVTLLLAAFQLGGLIVIVQIAILLRACVYEARADRVRAGQRAYDAMPAHSRMGQPHDLDTRVTQLERRATRLRRMARPTANLVERGFRQK